jgi:hypothetical protein
VQLDLEKTACDRMVQGLGNIIRSYSHPYILSSLLVAPVHTSDIGLLSKGLKSLKLVAKRVGLTLTGAYLSPDSGFDSTQLEVHFQCWHDLQYQRESSQSQNHQAWAEAVLSCSHPCFTSTGRADLRVGKFKQQLLCFAYMQQ